MGKQISKSDAKRKKRPKRTVVVSEAVERVMFGLSQTEKDAIRAALRSAAAIRRLPVALVVAADNGPMYTACVTDDMRLIYQIEPDSIQVVLLLSAGDVDYLRGTKVGSGSNGKPKS